MSDSVVIIPTYNEKENIQEILTGIFSQEEDFHVLVVDDNSPDGTAQIVKNLHKDFSERLHLKICDKKNGLGKAYLRGFEWALEHSYTFIFEMDADLSHNPADLIRLKKASKEADMTIGSRYCNGVNVVNWPMQRVLLSYFASKYVRFITGLPVHDATAGFICYKREALKEIIARPIHSSGYLFQVETKYRAWKKRLHILEIPIIFTERNAGESKMTHKIFWEALWGVLALRFSKV